MLLNFNGTHAAVLKSLIPTFDSNSIHETFMLQKRLLIPIHSIQSV